VPRLGVEPLVQRHRPDQVGEDDGNDLAPSAFPVGRGDCAVTDAPQAPQNRASGPFSTPHAGQRGTHVPGDGVSKAGLA
jgi:hypothetical protein